MATALLEEAPLTPTSEPIYARFVFKEHQQAISFAKLIVEREWTVSVVFAPEHAHWEATVRRQIESVFRDVTIWLATLSARATQMNGERDGWGHEKQA